MGLRKDREGRGWGPFTGGQLTIIIVVATVMLMLPIGALAAVKGDNVFITDSKTGKQAAVNALGQLTMGVGAQTVIISQGDLSVDSFTSGQIFTNVDVRKYHGVRLILGESGADPAAQTATVLSSVIPYVLDNFVMNSANVTRFYETPGLSLSVTVANNDSANTADYTWRLYGRPN